MKLMWHQVEQAELGQLLATDLAAGLTAAQAQERLTEAGANELAEKPRDPLWRKFVSQLNNFLVLILLAAGLLSLAVGEVTDAVVILAIVLLNAVVGVIQENKAENALAALKKMAAPSAKVIRDGRLLSLPSRAIVPGDVVIVEAGDYVPADLRFIEAVNLRIEEASLTGESVPADKRAARAPGEVPIGERHNMGYMGTVVVSGRGTGAVVATGMRTEIGQIAQMLDTFGEEQTPLQRNLQTLSKKLGLVCLAICAVIFAVGLYRGFSTGSLSYAEIQLLMMTAVSLAVAAIPEGLPAIVTLVLALGMQRMARRNVLVRKLHAVETLGSVTVICSDKTGTLTQNKMSVASIYAGGQNYAVAGEGYRPQGLITADGKPVDSAGDPLLATLLRACVLCNDATLKIDEATNDWAIIGDPTEGALLVVAAKGGVAAEQLRQTHPRLGELPFDSQRKLMTTFHANGAGGIIAFVKGAPDVLLAKSSRILRGPGADQLRLADREAATAANIAMAADALRVLSVGYREFASLPAEISPAVVEQDLTFVGLVGMIDPPRPEAREAIELSNMAGIRPLMITGDYPQTALAIAQRVGLVQTDEQILTGSQLDKMSPEAIRQAVKKVNVYARVSPANKVAILDSLQANGEIAAMTGDGVNDAPALKKADIGVAMGIGGTDVAKETADMVLIDDNFASIVAAVEEGRVIYSNIRKTVYFLLSCNLAEITIIFVAMLLGWPIPLLPVHLLWLNLVTDSFPAFALSLERKEPDVMKVPPRPPGEPILTRAAQTMIGLQSAVISLAVLAAFRLSLGLWGTETARTVAFGVLTLSELLRAYSSRSERLSVFSIGFFSNRYMNYGVLISLGLLALSIYSPLAVFMKTAGIGWPQLITGLGFAVLPFVGAEAAKVYLRKG